MQQAEDLAHVCIDIGKDTLDACKLAGSSGKQMRHFKNSPTGHQKLTQWIGEEPAKVCMEASGRNVAASTQNQALNALVFPYKQVLEVELGSFDGFARARRSPGFLPSCVAHTALWPASSTARGSGSSCARAKAGRTAVRCCLRRWRRRFAASS